MSRCRRCSADTTEQIRRGRTRGPLCRRCRGPVFAPVPGLAQMGRTRQAILGMVLDGAARRHPPSIREMGRMLGVCDNTVFGHLRCLRAAGLVGHEPRHARTVLPACRFVPADELGE